MTFSTDILGRQPIMRPIKRGDEAKPCDECAMGMAMMRAARMEGHRGKAPSMQNRGSELFSREVDAEILRVIKKEMTTRQITDAVCRGLGREIHIKTIGGRLRGPLFDLLHHRKATCGAVWTMKQ